jgi:hypothetical protein
MPGGLTASILRCQGEVAGCAAPERRPRAKSYSAYRPNGPVGERASHDERTGALSRLRSAAPTVKSLSLRVPFASDLRDPARSGLGAVPAPSHGGRGSVGPTSPRSGRRSLASSPSVGRQSQARFHPGARPAAVSWAGRPGQCRRLQSCHPTGGVAPVSRLLPSLAFSAR